MNILALDQARHGAWAIFDSDKKTMTDYGTWAFEGKDYTFEQAILQIEMLVGDVIKTHNIDAVFIEDIQLRKNVQSFKKLAQLQGVLVNLCEKTNLLYKLIAPTQWQNYCKARGRTANEVKSKLKEAPSAAKKGSKILSLQFVQDKYGIETDNDNLSDAICIGHYAVNNLEISKGEQA